MNAQNTLFQLMLKDEASDFAISHSLLKRSSVYQSFQSMDVLLMRVWFQNSEK